MTETRHVKIFDTTLRDGEQSPGISLNAHEKVEIARQLERLGVDIIEAGFAISSAGESQAVRAVAAAVRSCSVASLNRTQPADIEASWAALRDAAAPRMHVFIATSDIHMQHKLRMTEHEVIEQARAGVRLARKYVPDVEFSCEDATRSRPEFMALVIRAAIDAGASTINIPDTVGYTTPDEYIDLLGQLYGLVPELASCTVSVHCHDDLGLATANSIAGISAGARQVECTINGIGERAGNAATEEIVMLLRTRQAKYGIDTRIEAREIARASRLVSRLTGYGVQPNKAIVGKNAFAHESGIHQHGVLALRRTYEIMDAESIGLARNEIVLGKHSGRHALQMAFEAIGYTLTAAELQSAFRRFKEIADRKKQITAMDLEAIVADRIRDDTADQFTLETLAIRTTTGQPAWARVVVSTPDRVMDGEAEGDGPIDATFLAIEAAIGVAIELREFSVNAVDQGNDALGEVRVVCVFANRTVSAQGVSTDITEAAARAYLRAASLAVTAGPAPANQPLESV
jgi:2-isopropylmalate synthase